MEKSDMRRTKRSFGKLDWTNLLEMAAVGILLAGGFPARSAGQQQGQKTFSSPENAINALVTAAQNNDEEAMLDVLGPDGKQIVSSGDEAEHAEYAQKIFSDAGQYNGLYWKVAEGDPPSPIGPLVASAVAQGYAKSRDDAPTPYRGYYYHILTRHGKNAPGGVNRYIVNGKMTGGFAFVAYPAEYRSSGVMTFIVGVDGVVYQKDLGKKTEVLARGMKEYNPDSRWQTTKEQEEMAADPKASGKK